MFNYEKRLEHPVNITNPNPRMAQLIITQFGGPDGELGASMRYLSQRFAMPYKECMAVLTDIGNEGLLLHTPWFKSESFWRTKIHFCGRRFNFTSTRWSG